MSPGSSDVRLHFVIFTTVARHAHSVRTLESVAHSHPDASTSVVVIDDRFGEITRGRPGWRSVSPLDVGGARRLAELAVLYPATERIAAVRPMVLRRLASTTTADVIVTVPDDSEVLTPLDALTDLAVRHGVALAPVRAGAVPRDGRLPDPADHLRLGRIDRDLTAVSVSAGLPFLDWWANQIGDGALDDPDRFDPVGHSWLDDAFLLHRTALLYYGAVRSYRNLDEAGDLDAAPQGRALVVRFTGMDINRPWMLSEHGGAWPRVLLSEYRVMGRLARARAAAVASNTVRAGALRDPYARLTNGHPIDVASRRVYRRALVSSERHGHAAPPNPFMKGEEQAFVDWLAEPTGDGLTRHLTELRSLRSDLAQQFANDTGALVQWARVDAPRSKVWTPLPKPVAHEAPLSVAPAAAAGPSASGVNVVGMLSAQLGVGEQGRLLVRALRDAAVPFSAIDHDDTVNERDAALLADLGAQGSGFPYDVDLLLVNAEQTAKALAHYGRGGRSQRPTIGLWVWEVPTFPERMHGAFDLVDEVWVPTEFVYDALVDAGAQRGVEVRRVPLQLPSVRERPSPDVTAPVVAGLGLDPHRPLFLFSFDYFSVAERKQPWAVVEAFKRAFPMPMPDGPQLVIKSINEAFHPTDRERLLHSAGGRLDVHLIDGYLSAADRDALLAHASAYVSLHRSEGLGLTLAEAMAIGVPCIATGWSGNTDFMTESNSWLVPFDLVDIDLSVPVYAGQGTWAEPDVDVAAECMRTILADPGEAARRAAQAIADLDARNRSGDDAAFVLDRLRARRQADRSAARRVG